MILNMKLLFMNAIFPASATFHEIQSFIVKLVGFAFDSKKSIDFVMKAFPNEKIQLYSQ
jgi:hypothetical protein